MGESRIFEYKIIEYIYIYVCVCVYIYMYICVYIIYIYIYIYIYIFFFFFFFFLLQKGRVLVKLQNLNHIFPMKMIQILVLCAFR